MSESSDTRDRVVALEVKVLHLTEKIVGMDQKVTALHDLLLQARGARYVIVASAAVGGFVSAKLATFLPWFMGK